MTREVKKTKMLPLKSDFVFKLFFGDERNIDLLTDLLISVLDLPKDEYETIEIVDPHLLREYKDDKLGILDVKVKTKSGKLIDIEIQVNLVPEMTERVVFYTSKMLTKQIGKSSNYKSIKRVISIVITDFEFVAGDNIYHHKFTLYDRENDKQFTDLFELHALELVKLPIESDKTELYDWLSLIKAERKEDLDMIAQNNPQIKKAVGILVELSADERAQMLYESREMARMDEESRMNGALNEGLTKGLAKGEALANERWQKIVADTVAEKDAALADKEAEIMRLHALLDKKQ
jgi:predicted transposase/invertase (TIGR01784 family)